MKNICRYCPAIWKTDYCDECYKYRSRLILSDYLKQNIPILHYTNYKFDKKLRLNWLTNYYSNPENIDNLIILVISEKEKNNIKKIKINCKVSSPLKNNFREKGIVRHEIDEIQFQKNMCKYSPSVRLHIKSKFFGIHARSFYRIACWSKQKDTLTYSIPQELGDINIFIKSCYPKYKKFATDILDSTQYGLFEILYLHCETEDWLYDTTIKNES